MFTAKVAELHTKGVSPNGKYRFPVPTFMGQMPQHTDRTDSWEEFFSTAMMQLMAVIGNPKVLIQR
jgi:protein-ribulosamine 3-kinase